MAKSHENEAEAVRTTIVGGRPPGSGRKNVPVPRGIEVLVKKAAVDAEFRALLLAQRGRAATSIELELDPAESAMLNAIPHEQLAQIVDQTQVGKELRSAFMGRVGGSHAGGAWGRADCNSGQRPARTTPSCRAFVRGSGNRGCDFSATAVCTSYMWHSGESALHRAGVHEPGD